MKQALDNMVKLLIDAGTDVLRLINIQIYVADIRDMQETFQAWDSWFSMMGISPAHRPVRNIIESRLKDRILKVELYAHAVLPPSGERPLAGGVPRGVR
jgi:enamine deaminase RidA (YjgF/YER057c/UK114 family)